MTNEATPTPFVASWPEPDRRYLRAELPAPPELRLRDVLRPRLARWVEEAARAKGAPPDYVFAALLSVSGALLGNTRWVSPWKGWAEPPLIWTMCIGLPSAGKTPAFASVLTPLRDVERPLRETARKQLEEWTKKADLAKMAESVWKETARAAIKEEKHAPEKPVTAEIGPRPHIPRLIVNDGTIEKLAVILAQQPRGTFQMRDELAGWLEGMQRYAGGGSDRPFWLEAYGGQGFTVERMGREPLTVDRLTIGVTGGIQPDRLRTLLLKSDDDGLLARLVPIWPNPAPVQRPRAWADEDLIKTCFERLLCLEMVSDDEGGNRPWIVPFDDGAKDALDDFRRDIRALEAKAEGLMLSFIGKLPGLAARLSLVLSFLDWAAEDEDLVGSITAGTFKRATDLVVNYILPMARRAYADAATPKAERAARRLLAIIREQGWLHFSSRDVLRLDRAGLGNAAELKPALAFLEEGDCIRALDPAPNPKGGRPQRLFSVNPAVLEG